MGKFRVLFQTGAPGAFRQALMGLDTDREPWMTSPPAAQMGHGPRAVPRSPPAYVSMGVGEGEAGVADAGTEPDDASWLGHVAGIDTGGLTQYISLWTVAVLAWQVINGPVDPEDERAINYAAQVATATEHLLCANIAVGTDGALQTGGLPGAEWWLRYLLYACLHRPN